MAETGALATSLLLKFAKTKFINYNALTICMGCKSFWVTVESFM